MKRLILAAMLLGGMAHSVPAQMHAAKTGAAVPAKPGDPDQALETQQALLKMLRVTPVLTEVLSRDASLLTDQAYISRTNPPLAEFLTAHPEVVRNPEYYLFSGLGSRNPNTLTRRVWQEPAREDNLTSESMIARMVVSLIGFLCVLGALVWLIRALIENRRTARSFNTQIETHSKLIDRFTSNPELLAYMETEAGRRFLEAVPPAEQEQKVPNVVARVMTSLQVGLLLTVLGIGFLVLYHYSERSSFYFKFGFGYMIIGILLLMPGIGFIISAAMTWSLAERLGLMPAATKPQDRA